MMKTWGSSCEIKDLLVEEQSWVKSGLEGGRAPCNGLWFEEVKDWFNWPTTGAEPGMAESPSTDPAESVAARADRAVVVLKGEGVTGTVNFEQRTPRHPMKITGTVQGLPQGQHGIAIHEFGDLSKGWKSTGNHFNPFKKDHGGPEDKIRHLGDLGNITVDNDGTGHIDITDKILSLSGKNSILGRTLVIHEQPDDLGKGGKVASKKNGNTGNGVAMGVIGVQKI
ncbi:hypothetical protein GE061_004726 [Apolygus lucorum]|uniref:superoxide dismutase n=1 Tax=Apolygus lucorum TaxID=248454 RepID=A0A8S9X1S7_APOLU|nr:hypothetical protein GE061_004726 [Apolygus lucorum]